MAKKKDRLTCPIKNPCTYAKSKWPRLAKMFIETVASGNETGTSYCRNDEGKLSVARYCRGGRCSVSIVSCAKPLTMVGSIHTHPYKDPDAMIKVQDKAGEFYHSSGDLRSALRRGEEFSCVILNNGKGECLAYKKLPLGKSSLAISKLPKSPSSGVSRKKAYIKSFIKARCALDIRGKVGGEWLSCEK